jgi:hypothetical protein
MTSTIAFRISMAIAIGSGALLAAGCATPPSRPPGVYVPAPIGTVATYHRKSSGSYGTVDGTVQWTHGLKEWQGRAVIASVSPQAGTNLVDPTTGALIATLDTAGRPTFSYDPPLGYEWPLEVGKTWTSRHMVTNHANQRTTPIEVTNKVEAHEDVTVPAGTFKSYRLRITTSLGEVTQQWTMPSQGLGTVKRILDRPATHPMGAGHLEGELTALTRPK